MSERPPPSPADHRPTASLAALRRRARLLTAVRDFFLAEGYWEVETPLLSHDVCIDVWLDPFLVPCADASPGASPQMYLQTSPEFAMKRLVAAGADAIYQITRSFRRGESGERHNPEFTIVEWYRVGATAVQQMDLVERLVRAVRETPLDDETAGVPHVRPPLPAAPLPRLSYDEAFERFAGQRVLHCDVGELAALAARLGVCAPPGNCDRDAWLNLLLAHVVEPGLAKMGAVFVFDYPASQSALARIRHGSPPVSERFELYLEGLEICNGYQELTDAAALEARMHGHAVSREAAGLSSLPTDSRLLSAMRGGFPDCAGGALGFDRLAMWRLGATALSEVLAFPFDRA